MQELEQYLRNYMYIDDDDMSILLSYFHITEMYKGDHFVKAGRVCDKLSFQKSGLIRCYAMHDDKEVTQWISSKGFIITDLGGLIMDQPSRCNVYALTHCELFTISKQDYLNLENVLPSWPKLERMLITKCFGFMEKRLFAQISMTAEEQYKYMMDQNPDLFTQVPLKYLASMMGMTAESLSRIRNKMTNAG
jgi:CRP/FNR family transcriptional regulator, anaerobic regulatory protein